jgi:hypothetical protein
VEKKVALVRRGLYAVGLMVLPTASSKAPSAAIAPLAIVPPFIG